MTRNLLLCLGFMSWFSLTTSLQASGEISLTLTPEVIGEYPETTVEAIQLALETGEAIYYGGSTATHHLFFIDRTSFEGNMPWVFYDKRKVARELLVVPDLRELDFTSRAFIVLQPNDHPRLEKVESKPVLKFKEF